MTHAPESGAAMPDGEFCSLSQRVDGQKHTWKFWGDDPYVICHWCEELRHVLTGRTLRPGRGAALDADRTGAEEESGE